MKQYSLLFVAAIVSIVSGSCKADRSLLDENVQWMAADTVNNAQVKFINAYSSITPAITAGYGPSLRIFRNDQKLTGTTATLDTIGYGAQFPATTAYSIVPAGSNTFYFVMNRIVSGAFAPRAGDTVFRKTQNLEAGKKYTFFLVDTVQNPDVMVVEDKVINPGYGKYALRFVNLVANPSDRYDFFSVKQGRNIFSNIGYKQITEFIALPKPQANDTFYLRNTGNTHNVSSAVVAPADERVYTFYARGKAGIAIRDTTLAVYTNR